MAAESSGCVTSVRTVLTCEGNLSDPEFPQRLRGVVGRLQRILRGAVKVYKLEPWNSVRVTLSIPREAALRLRQLAADGSQLLRALGILSVQVDGDQVISLRIAGPTSSEPHEVVLRTGQDGGECGSSNPGTSRTGLGDMLSGLLSGNNSQSQLPTSGVKLQAEKVQFKSPNVVCPPDSVVPRPTVPMAKTHAGPFPFTSMNQALHSSAFVAPKPKSKMQMPPPPPPPPPPYPTTMSSPLLVNLLQNDSATTSAGPSAASVRLRTPPSVPVPLRHSSVLADTSTSPSALASTLSRPPPSASAPPSHFAQVPHPPKTFMPPPPPPKPVPVSLPMPVNVSSATANTSMDSFRLDAHSNLDTLRMDPHPLDTHRIDPQVIDAHAQRIEPNMLDSTRIDQHLLDLQTLDIHALDTHAIDAQVLDRHLRPPPPYSEAVARSWQPLMDLTPALPDLKDDDLDELLPSLEDLENDPPILPEDLLSTSPINLPPVPDRRHFLINPLTGELEPHSGGESEVEEIKDVFKGLESPARLSDEDSSSTVRPDSITDHSDSDSRSQIMVDGSKASRMKNKVREKGRDSPTMKPTEKIKLRLKLEKTEPPSPAYKVDVSFINTQPKKAATSVMAGSPSSSTPTDGELRVPPLHISLKGRNHVVITNKKKVKLPGEKAKVRRLQDNPNKLKKLESDEENVTINNLDSLISEQEMLLNDQLKNKNQIFEMKKAKKLKLNHDFSKELQPNNSISNATVNSAATHIMMNEAILKTRIPMPDPPPYKERQDPPPYKERTDDPPPYKERRGSDSELIRSLDKYAESNGVAVDEKRRRLSQTDILDPGEPPTSVPGSTNIGTISALPQKIRKEKPKGKDMFKGIKDVNRNKNHSTKINKPVSLPTGDVDMEAKFKQRLLEGSGPPHRTEVVHQVTTMTTQVQVVPETPPVVETDKCNTPDHSDSAKTTTNINNNNNNSASNGNAGSCSINATGNNNGTSVNSAGSTGSGGTREGEDSGIESMDALSEKSPNQVGQSPPTDNTSKTQVPDMLDIEAQLAKMEGQCCETTAPSKEELEPLPVRVTPPLYTYSNPDKGRSDSPPLSDEDSNSCSGTGLSKKSLLEQLLIDIPEQPVVSMESPTTRSVRTRATSKLSSPVELNSPASVKSAASLRPITKRKRQESESSNASLDENNRSKKQLKKSPDLPDDIAKPCLTIADVSKVNNNQGKKPPSVPSPNQNLTKAQDESSDSDEPLMEKVRKTNNVVNSTTTAAPPTKGKVKPAPATPNNNKNSISTRRSMRTAMPAQNTRSKGDKPVVGIGSAEPDIARRKTRSAASEVDKRKKEVK